MQARSLVPLIEGGEGRARAFAEHARDMILKGTACMTMLRDRRWKLVHFVDSPEGQLFARDADPREVRNLWDNPAHAGRRRGVVEDILRWRTLTAMTPAPLPGPAR